MKLRGRGLQEAVKTMKSALFRGEGGYRMSQQLSPYSPAEALAGALACYICGARPTERAQNVESLRECPIHEDALQYSISGLMRGFDAAKALK